MTKHSERRIIPHEPQNLYALVADVQSYPEFLPWCLGARMREESDEKLVADLIIGFRFYREKFTSYVDLYPKTLEIKVEYADGPFKYLQNSWKFLPHEEGCEIDFYVDFEFQSRLFQSMIETLFQEATKRMVSAFETRADTLYPKVTKKLSKKPKQ